MTEQTKIHISPESFAMMSVTTEDTEEKNNAGN